MNETIGKIDCPLCGAAADVRNSGKKAKPYIVCGAPLCGFQGFARGNGACDKLRAKMRPVEADKSAPPPPVAKPAPAAPAPAVPARSWLDAL